MVSKKSVILGIGFSLVIIFGMLNATGIISEVTYSSDSTVIFEGISENPFQVYEINTVCELADLLLENNFSFSSYQEDFEKEVPDEWNEWKSTIEAKKKFWSELTDEQRTDDQYLTTEAEIELQEVEQKVKPSYYRMIMKYFSINPDLEGEFLVLYEYLPYSLLWLKEYHPECTLLLEEKYG
ncbi:MAG: hypothetical protein IIC67_03765 [Thaumarchaeota archaeon]|nr:hypothetical protein [Nitrososphaerota archaeon]